MTDPTDPFDVLSAPVEPQTPRPAFARDLRAQIVAELDLAVVDLPERNPIMSTAPTTTTTTTNTGIAAVLGSAHVVPYLTVSDGPAALDWYAEALGAVEQLRVVGDDGRIGHAGFSIGGADFMLSDDYPEIGVQSPATLGGTSFGIHLTVADVDALFARAVAAGATSMREPADQPHGARQGALVDPWGHRWMLSQEVEALTVADYVERSKGSGFAVVAGQPAPGNAGGIWGVVFYEDALAGIRHLVDVFGFEELFVTTADDGVTVVHSELRWRDGGIIQIGTYNADSPYAIPPGTQAMYLVTPDPMSVWAQCVAAGLEVMQEPYSPHYDPDGLSFTVRDIERNIWSVGSYGVGR